MKRTVDGGTTWTDAISDDILGYAFSVFATDRDHVWVGGDHFGLGGGAKLLASEDGGLSWQPQIITDGLSRIMDISFVDANNGWAVGDSSFLNRNVLHTTDGGQTHEWQQVGNNIQQIWSIDFLNPTVGYVARTINGEVFKTVDGGANWTPQTTGTTEELFSLDFLNESEGWVGGDQGLLLHTFNGGVTWEPQNSGTNFQVMDLSLLSASHGWFVTSGFGGQVRSTVNGGNAWLLDFTAEPETVLSQLSFISADEGWVVGSNGLIFHRLPESSSVPPAAPVIPEPSSVILLGMGLVTAGMVGRRSTPC